MENLEYIKKFSKINIASICRKLNIDRGNLINGRLKENINKSVREEIESELAKLYIIEDNNDKKN